METVATILKALDAMTGGRCITSFSDVTYGKNPWVVMKSSGIPGKSCMERPGLIWGDLDMPVKKVAVCMTLTESVIELAGATGVDAIIAHHPACEAANSGGVYLSAYLKLYGLAFFELHEAFHGLHPGIPWLHGHMPIYTNTSYGGVIGNVVNVGNVIDGIETLNDLKNRLNDYMDFETELELLKAERELRKCGDIEETSIAARCKIYVGEEDSRVSQIIHIHPHCSFTTKHLEELKLQFPDADTVVASISRIPIDNELVIKAKQLKMNFVCGNSHALEIYENGVPLAYALHKQLPSIEIVIFKERQISIPLDYAGSTKIRKYGMDIADEYLTKV